MRDPRNARTDELNAIIDTKLTALVQELEDANWSVEDIAVGIQQVLNRNWLDQVEAMRRARAAVPDNFVSDGNEG
ncbi:hypothetical protein MNR02_20690 (plasmid) [Shinella sp. H4-D48]|uniref:hypothetical protein n=1 Tax=Shinella sp. H4-D48 TaxID=2925841 RepID=UPI001F5317B0|nr:hypothetical protein [Shinella sp. H4-D48]UNK40156.1 hypothetical protein MNR02_20690 [Shinella sp. H4-D48]